MIDVRISKKEIDRCKITGTTAEILAEFTLLINQFYSAMAKTAPQLLPSIREYFAKITAPGSPMCADYCPVADNPGVCKYEERGNSDAQKGKRQTGAK